MAEKKTAAQRRQEALRIHPESSFRMMGQDLVANVHASEFNQDRVAAQRVGNKFKAKGWSVVVTSKGGIIATVQVPR